MTAADSTQAQKWLEEPLREGHSPAPATDEDLRNSGLETITQCARRMLVQHQGDRRDGMTAMHAARLTAEGVARSWRIVGNTKLADFYGRVAASLSEG